MELASYQEVRELCLEADYDALGDTFCALHPGGTYQRQVASYTLDNAYSALGAPHMGSDYVHCGS